MAHVYISSIFQDLRDYREAVYVALRRLGHDSVAVEDWAATEQPPVEKCIVGVRSSDVAVFLVAWRYGYVPPGQTSSITELEYRAASEVGKSCLIFLLHNEAPWPVKYIDDDSTNIRRFREELSSQHIVAFFKTPNELAMQVAVSMQRWVSTGTRELVATPLGTVPVEETLGPEVFLSYAHENVSIAQSIAERIGRQNWSVFWDRTIPVGFTWDDIVEEALDAAKCVVVLWSEAARASEWVRIEATEGADRGILAPALIEQTKIPLRFRRIQAADFCDIGSDQANRLIIHRKPLKITL